MIVLCLQANDHVREYRQHLAKARAQVIPVTLDPAAWRRARSTLIYGAIARAPAHDGTPKMPVVWEKSAPGPDLANKHTRHNARLGVFTHALRAPRPERRPRRTYRMRCEGAGQKWRVFDVATGVLIAIIQGSREWIKHEVILYAHSLHASSTAFCVLPFIATDCGPDGPDPSVRDRSPAYVSP